MTNCLVVDDVEVTRFVATELLSDMGMKAVAVEDGSQALKVLETQSIDVVFLDWHLRRVSGLDLLREIRAKYGSRLSVVVFSGVEKQGMASQAMEAGANAFLEKPTTREKVADCLKKLNIAS